MSQNRDKPLTMYEWNETNKKKLYVANKHHKKLLQVLIRSEPYTIESKTFAQIKIIPYAVDNAKVYNDKSNDPKIIQIYQGIELTYHGQGKDGKTPKIHLKIISQSNTRYRTLVDCSLLLDNALPRFVPIFSYLPGYEYDKPLIKKISKKAHLFKVNSDDPIRFDFYLSGKDIDHHAYFLSMYSLNMFSNLDYLIAKKNFPLEPSPIVQPIAGFTMKNYILWVRCSNSTHIGKPFIQFYNNKNYYHKFMNRVTAGIDKNGRAFWSTMYDDEREIKTYLANQK